MKHVVDEARDAACEARKKQVRCDGTPIDLLQDRQLLRDVLVVHTLWNGEHLDEP